MIGVYKSASLMLTSIDSSREHSVVVIAFHLEKRAWLARYIYTKRVASKTQKDCLLFALGVAYCSLLMILWFFMTLIVCADQSTSINILGGIGGFSGSKGR